jgi:hypothetical protein
MRERKILEWIVKWVSSSIGNRTMTLYMPGYNTDAFLTQTGIPQGSPLSPILFFLYNTYLIDACNLPTLPSSGLGFVNDVSTMAFSKTTENNCRMLQSLYERCLEWAKSHGALFEVYPCALYQSNDQTQHRLPSHLALIYNQPQPICSCIGGYSQQKPQLAAVSVKHQAYAGYPDQCSHNAYGLNMGVSLRVLRLLYIAVIGPAITTGCPA